ncbi:MAG: AAA domain-containing protein [Candidatus Electrothrix sp.]
MYETVNANTGLFDVIIVDEASQCVPEALPLFQLGKRLIVVGDDKQISPEAVGINQEQVQQLMRTWLADFDHADSFGPDTSLFDHCQIRFQNRISLREHFRCMPEIIRFSSTLCYIDNPLIPLRQYTPDRLEPLQSVFVETGYREGVGQRVINQPEAEAIVEEIKKCCENQKYSDKSIGVIVLQGTEQGIKAYWWTLSAQKQWKSTISSAVTHPVFKGMRKTSSFSAWWPRPMSNSLL